MSDWISVGVLAGSVPRDVIDEAVLQHGRQAERSDGKLPPHVMVYFAMALALFADEDYEEVMTRLSSRWLGWGCWDRRVDGADLGRDHPGAGPARSRAVVEVFEQVAVPVAEQLDRGACWGRGG